MSELFFVGRNPDGDGWVIWNKDRSKILEKGFKSKEEAERRLGQIEYFKKEHGSESSGKPTDSKEKQVKAVIGKRRGHDNTEVQSFIFSPKDKWTVKEAKDWLDRNGKKHGEVDETGDSFRFRQEDPAEFDGKSFRVIPITHDSSKMSEPPRFVAQLSEAAAAGTIRIPLAVTGEWHRGDRQFSITREDLEAAIKNFQAKLNGEINVDYDHASEMPEVAAGGPIPSAGKIIRLDSPQPISGGRYLLWGHYEPTDRARELIKNREYRYISPAIDWGARSKQNGERQGATITSVALTNRPFLEEMPEIHLSDPAYRLVDTGSVHVDGSMPNFSVQARQGAGAKETSMAKRLSISPIKEGEHAGHHAIHDGEEMMGYVTHGDAKKSLGAIEDNDGDEQMSELMAEAKVSNIGDLREHIRLAEASRRAEETRRMVLSEAVDQKTGMLLGDKLDRLVESGRLQFADCRRFERAAQMVEDGVKTGKVAPATRPFFLRAAVADPDGFRQFLSSATPVVDLGERGIAGSEHDADVQARMKAMIAEKMKDGKLTYGQALSEVGREHPELVREYRRAVTGSQAIQ